MRQYESRAQQLEGKQGTGGSLSLAGLQAALPTHASSSSSSSATPKHKAFSETSTQTTPPKKTQQEVMSTPPAIDWGSLQKAEKESTCLFRYSCAQVPLEIHYVLFLLLS